jgi:chemotaxis protein MotA
MDKTTAIGFGLGWALVALAIILGGVGFGPYIDVPSVLIVIGGTSAVIVGSFEGSQLKNFTPAMKVAFNELSVESPNELVEKMVFYATEIKKNGVMQIEQKVLQEPNPFFKEAFQQIVDGTKPEIIEQLLETKLENMDARHNAMIAVFGGVGGVAGSMGMIGTLVGLVAMLANLSDPAAVGPAMAVALLTTMYGALLGTLFAGILESKLTQKNRVEVEAYTLIIQGVVMIASEESIGDIKMKLNAALASVEE